MGSVAAVAAVRVRIDYVTMDRFLFILERWLVFNRDRILE